MKALKDAAGSLMRLKTFAPAASADSLYSLNEGAGIKTRSGLMILRMAYISSVAPFPTTILVSLTW